MQWCLVENRVEERDVYMSYFIQECSVLYPFHKGESATTGTEWCQTKAVIIWQLPHCYRVIVIDE